MLTVILIQPSSVCNLNCKYCYLDRSLFSESDLMSPETLDKILRLTLHSRFVSSDFMINWHVGEPLAAKIPFYEHAAKAIKENNINHIDVRQVFQTNGTLINEKWCEFSIRHNIGWGISVDGPAFLHDAMRVDKRGEGTHARVMRGVNFLRQHHIPYAGLCVLSTQSFDYPDEIYAFFRENGFSNLAFNVEEVESFNLTSSHNLAGTPRINPESRERYYRFMSRIYDLWVQDGKAIDIREFRDLEVAIAHKIARPDAYRNQGMSALSILSFKKNGDISAFSPELAGGVPGDPDKFVIANVHDIDSLDELLLNPKFNMFWDDISKGVARCAKECTYFDLCGGVFSSNKFSENGTFDSTETTSCQLHRQVLSELILDKLEASATHG